MHQGDLSQFETSVICMTFLWGEMWIEQPTTWQLLLFMEMEVNLMFEDNRVVLLQLFELECAMCL